MNHHGTVNAVAFSPDGKTILTGSGGTARLWDATTGQPLGPPMTPKDGVVAVAFSPDGKTVLTQIFDEAITARLWDVPELPDNLERIATWVEVMTGLVPDERGSVSLLDNPTWASSARSWSHKVVRPRRPRAGRSIPSSSALIPLPAPRSGSSESMGGR